MSSCLVFLSVFPSGFEGEWPFLAKISVFLGVDSLSILFNHPSFSKTGSVFPGRAAPWKEWKWKVPLGKMGVFAWLSPHCHPQAKSRRPSLLVSPGISVRTARHKCVTLARVDYQSVCPCSKWGILGPAMGVCLWSTHFGVGSTETQIATHFGTLWKLLHLKPYPMWLPFKPALDATAPYLPQENPNPTPLSGSVTLGKKGTLLVGLDHV